MKLLAIFFATFCYVMLRALQQRNVAHENYAWIPPVSYAMAAADVFIVTVLAHVGWTLPVVLANGTGGALGALAAVFFHKRFILK